LPINVAKRRPRNIGLRDKGLRLLRGIQRRSFRGRSESVKHAAVVVVCIVGFDLSGGAALCSELRRLGGSDESEVMFRVL
jgi:hypothetical protein